MSAPVQPRVLLTEGLREYLRESRLDEETLVQQFRDWKALAAVGKEHFAFGRDAAGLGNRHLRHVHMVPLFTPVAEQRWTQAWKRRGTRTSDRYLFYADGTPAFGYLLITLINDPGAHQVWQPQYRDFVEMIERIADDFHHHGKTPD